MSHGSNSRRPNSRRSALMAFAIAAVPSVVVTVAVPCAIADPVRAGVTKNFAIPAQDAVTAIPLFAQQSGLQVLAPAGDLKGVRTHAAQGPMTVDAALQVLLSDTGLSVRTRDATSAVIARAVTTEPVVPAQASPAPEPPELVVTGVRKALREALDDKRHDTAIVETISSKDIGALPDVTIAEELNRLPGVNAARDRGNDSQVSIRGLGTRMVLGTVNGREVASSEPDRSVRWEIYPSEVVAGVAVYKSSEAKLLSGGISGTVDIRTIRPLDYRGPDLVVRAGPVAYDGGYAFPGYNGMGYRGSLSYVARLSPQLAVVVGLTAQKQKNGFESVQGWGYNAGADTGPVLASQPATAYNTPFGAQAEAKKLTETRFGASLGVQYRPNAGFQLTYDLLYSDIRITEYQDQAWWGDGNWGNWDSANTANYVDGATYSGTLPTIIDGDVVAATVTWAADKSVIARYSEDKTLIVTGLNGKWTGGAWTVTADASYSRAERFNQWGASAFQYWPNYMRYDFTRKPVVTVSGNPEDSLQTTASGQWETGRVADDLKAVTLDARRDLAGGPFTSLVFGMRLSQRTKATGNATGLVAPVTTTPFDPSILTVYHFSNFNLPTLLTGDFDALARMLYGSSVIVDAKSQPISDRIVEHVGEAYAEGLYATEFGGVPVDGNIGIRWVSVSALSRGTSTQVEDWVETTPGSAVWYQPKTTTPVSGGIDYSRILPSATARFDFGAGRYLKLAAAKVISRPPLNDMIVTRQISGFAPYVGMAGNPYLRPFEATQFDASYEWYFNKDALAAASVYVKQVSHYVGYAKRSETINGTAYSLISPVNSTRGGYIRGVELTYQTPLSFLAGLDHFGVYSNAALVSSDLTEMSGSLPLNGLARSTATLDLWYAAHGIDARLGAKYHSEYTAIYGWNDSALIRVLPETTMDFSVSYRLNPHLRARFQISNLLDTPLRTYQDNRPTRLGRYDLYGRRMLFDLTFSY